MKETGEKTDSDAVESSLCQAALSGNIVAIIFYLKARRSVYRDKLNINVSQLQAEVEQRLAQFQGNSAVGCSFTNRM